MFLVFYIIFINYKLNYEFSKSLKNYKLVKPGLFPFGLLVLYVEFHVFDKLQINNISLLCYSVFERVRINS